MKRPLEGASLPENAIARQALENIAKIEQEAQQKKLEQLDSLKSAKSAIVQRLTELNHQLAQLEQAMGTITGRTDSSSGRKARKDWSSERERVGRWMEGRKGQKFAARDLMREFPELNGQVMSLFLKPLIEMGKIKTDTTEGTRRMKYFAA
jgi:chromosome segregation ATPase